MLKELRCCCFKSYGGSSKIQTGDLHKHSWWKRPRSYVYFEYFLKVTIIVNSSAYFVLALKGFFMEYYPYQQCFMPCSSWPLETAISDIMFTDCRSHNVVSVGRM